MVDIITTFTFELEHGTDTEGLRVAVELLDDAAQLLDFLSMELGARWPDERHFDIEFQYASTAEHRLQAIGVSGMPVRPKDPRLPLAKVVDEATALAEERADWDVSCIGILDERVAHVVLGHLARLDLMGRTQFGSHRCGSRCREWPSSEMTWKLPLGLPTLPLLVEARHPFTWFDTHR